MITKFETLSEVIVSGQGQVIKFIDPTYDTPGHFTVVPMTKHTGVRVYTSGTGMLRSTPMGTILADLNRIMLEYKEWEMMITETTDEDDEERVRYALTLFASKESILAHIFRNYMDNEDWDYDYQNRYDFQIQEVEAIGYTEKGSEQIWETQISYDLKNELEITEFDTHFSNFGAVRITFNAPHTFENLIDNLKTSSREDWLMNTPLFTSDLDDLSELIQDLTDIEQVKDTVEQYLLDHRYEHYTVRVI